jgi:hypothetical protein
MTNFYLHMIILLKKIGVLLSVVGTFLATLFAPIAPFLVLLVGIIAYDTYLGIQCAKIRLEEIRFSRAWRGMGEKLVLFGGLIMIGFGFEINFFKTSPISLMREVPLLWAVSLFICWIELLSIDENLQVKFGFSFLKKGKEFIIQIFKHDFSAYLPKGKKKDEEIDTPSVFEQNIEIQGNKHAILVGLDIVDPLVYGSELRLRGCKNDAYNMKAFLKSQGYDTFILTNEQATIENVISAYTKLATKAKSGDTIVFYNSSHGALTGSNYMDKDKEDKGGDQVTCLYNGLVLDDVWQRLMRLYPKGCTFIFIWDTCHAETAYKIFEIGTQNVLVDILPKTCDVSKVSVANYFDVQKLEKLVPYSKKTFQGTLLSLTSCLENQTSKDGKYENMYQGFFTYSLLKALTSNPNLSFDEMSAIKIDMEEGDQTPVFKKSGKKINTKTKLF